MYNKVILMGRIANDLDLKTTEGGKSVVAFSIAVDREYQVKGQEKKCDFINIIAWTNTAEFITRNFVKGKPILIDGEIQTRKYKDKNGIERYITEVLASRASFTGDTKAPQQTQQTAE